MKKISKNRKWFSILFATIAVCLISFSFLSCNFLFEDTVTKATAEQTETPDAPASSGTTQTSEKNTFNLIINPSFKTDSADNSRSAYPQFSAAQLSGLHFHAICTDAFGDVEGTYNSENGKIVYTITCNDFSNKTITFLVKDGDGIALWFAQKEGVSYTRGTLETPTTIEITPALFFKPYTAALGNDGILPKGNIDLAVSAPDGSKIVCKIYDSTGAGTTLGESGESGKTITVTGTTNICLITTESGIDYGEYVAKFFIYKDGSTTSTPEYRQKKIVVWPGITTNAWYLTDGSKHNQLQIAFNNEEIKIYVKGTNPTGIYNATSLPSMATVADAADTNAGTILAPLQTINAAIAKCTSSTAKYKIICDGDFSGFNIGQASPATYNNCAITISGGGNSNNVSTIADGSAVTVYTNKAVLIENFKISNITDSTKDAITYSTNAACGLTLKNCEISNNAGLAIKTTNTLASDTKLIFMGSTYIPLTTTKTNYLSLGGSCKLYVNGSLDTSNDTGGNVRTIATVEYPSHNTGTQYIFAENGANLEVERHRFRYKTYPLYFDNTGSLQISTDFYVSASAASDGDGSAEDPLQTVTSALAIINEITPILGGAAFTIHISGTIKENDTINIVGSSGGSLSSFYNFNSTSPSTLTLCGTNKDNDKLDGNGTHQVLKIQGNPSYSLPVTIENLTIQNGKSSVSGGGIYASYTNLKLGNGCVITKNETSKNGGAVYLTSGNLFMYGDALIGYNNANTLTTSSAAKAAGGNIAAQDGGAIYAHGENLQNTCDCYIWIGYTSENVPDDSGKTPKISGNCIDTTYYGGGISYNAYVSLNICKGEISYNYAQKGGGIYSCYRGYSHNERNISGVTIKGNQAQYGGGIYVSSIGNGTGAGYLHLSGTTVIEENEALGDSGIGGAIYGGGEMEIEGAVYIPFEAVKKNDVYMPSGYQLKILDTLAPPPAANGITATFTPESYDTTTVLLKDDDSGQTVNDNYSKFKVTPNGTSNWKLKSDGSICIPFNVIVNNANTDYPYTDKLELYNSLTNYTYSGDIEITVLEMNEEDFGPASTNYTLLNAIKSAKASRVNLIVDEEANIKLPADSSNYFSSLTKVVEMDLRGLDTSNVTTMNNMFYICNNLESLNLSSFNTSKVTSMQTFLYSNKIKSLDLSSFDTSNVTNMNQMFGYCENITKLDLSNFDTSNVTDMAQMFWQDAMLKAIIVSSDFKVDQVTESVDMFTECNSLKGCKGTTISGNPKNISYARIDNPPDNPGYFSDVYYAQVSGINSSDLKYDNLSSLITALTGNEAQNKNITITLFSKTKAEDIGKPTTEGTIAYAIKNSTAASISLIVPAETYIKLNADSSSMFEMCTTLISVDLTGFDTSEVTNMDTMFGGCENIQTIDISGFNTSKVTRMNAMFILCTELESIYVSSSFNMSSVTNDTAMFGSCLKLKGGAGTAYDNTKEDGQYARIDQGSTQPGYFTSVADKPIQVTSSNIDDLTFIDGVNKLVITGSLNSTYISKIVSKIQTATDSQSIELDFSKIDNTNFINSQTLANCPRLTKATFDLNKTDLHYYPFCQYVMNMYANGCSNLRELKIIYSEDFSDNTLKDVLILTSVETLDLTECTGKILIDGEKLRDVAIDSMNYNTNLKEIKFGTHIAEGSEIKYAATFQNSNFKLSYNGSRDDITTANLKFDDNVVASIYIECNDGRKVYDKDVGEWQNYP